MEERMEIDRRHKTARLGEHVPGFRGYGSGHYRETDLQLRRVLAGEMEKVRDRLAAFLAGRELGERQEDFAVALRETAALKDELAPPEGAAETEAPEEEESLLDFDLALLENIAALNTPLERLERARSGADLDGGLEQYLLGLAEIFRLFRRRSRLLAGEGEQDQ
jgi:hypothetical protein